MMKIKELFADPKNWTSGAIARDKNGEGIEPLDANAVCWCLVGALVKRYPNTQYQIRHKIRAKIGINATIASFNDKEGYDKVLELVTELDI